MPEMEYGLEVVGPAPAASDEDYGLEVVGTVPMSGNAPPENVQPLENPEDYGFELVRDARSTAGNVFHSFLKGLASQSADAAMYLIRLSGDVRRNAPVLKHMDDIFPAGFRNFQDQWEQAAIEIVDEYKNEAVPLVYDPDEGFERSFGGQLSAAAGGMAPILVAGAATAGTGIAPLVVSVMAGAQSGGGAYDDAIESGASDREALNAAHLNAMFTAISEPVLGVTGRSTRRLARGIPMRDGVKKAVGDFAGEAIQEGSEQLFGNVVASDVVGFDPERKATEGVGTAMLIGGILGVGGNVAMAPLQAASNYDFRRAKDRQLEVWDEAGLPDEYMERFRAARNAEDWKKAMQSAGAQVAMEGLGVDREISRKFADRVRDVSTPEELEAVRNEIEQYLFKYHGYISSPFSRPMEDAAEKPKEGSGPDVKDLIDAEAMTDLSGKTGEETIVVGTKGQRFPAKYAIVPREELHASHLPNFQKNKEYQLENTRDYAEPNEQAKVLDVRNAFDPMQHVTDSPSASVGPVMVAKITGEDGKARLHVLGGNTRQMAIEGMPDEKRAALAQFTNERIDRFGLPPVSSPDEMLVRFLGEYDLRENGMRAKVQGIIDALNPSPGKVQNMMEMARVDAATSVPPTELTGLSMDVSPEEAVKFVARQIHDGNLDRNLRGQATESGESAQAYTRALMGNAAYGMPPLVDFMNRSDSPTLSARRMMEMAVPAVLEMRAKGQNDLADAVSRAMASVVQYMEATDNNLSEALDFAARQLELNPDMQVVNQLAEALSGLVVTKQKTRKRKGEQVSVADVQHDATIEAMQPLFERIETAMRNYTGENDLFGDAQPATEKLRILLEGGGQEAGVRGQESEWGDGSDPNILRESRADARTPTGKVTGQRGMAYRGFDSPKDQSESSRWQDGAQVIEQGINTMPVEDALFALDKAEHNIRQNAPDSKKGFLLNKAQERRAGLEKDRKLKEIAARKGRKFFDVTGWLAEDFGDDGWGHVVGGDVLVKVAVDGDGKLDPAYNVDNQGIFVNRGPGQAARIRLQNKGGMAPLVFSDGKLRERGITIHKYAEPVIDQKLPLSALNTEAKLRAVDVIFNELDYQGREITDQIVKRIARNLGLDESVVRARVSPAEVTPDSTGRIPPPSDSTGRIPPPSDSTGRIPPPSDSTGRIPPPSEWGDTSNPDIRYKLSGTQKLLSQTKPAPLRAYQADEFLGDVQLDLPMDGGLNVSDEEISGSLARKNVQDPAAPARETAMLQAISDARGADDLAPAEREQALRRARIARETFARVRAAMAPGAAVSIPDSLAAEIRALMDEGLPLSTIIPEFYKGPAVAWPVTGAVVRSPRDAAALAMMLRSPYQESIKALYLDADNRVVEGRVVTLGMLDASLASPAVLAAPKGAKKVIVLHNHPSGDPTPSADDIKVTRNLLGVAEAAGIPVVDHVITDGGRYASIREMGLVDFGAMNAAGEPVSDAAGIEMVDQAEWEAIPTRELMSIKAPQQFRTAMEVFRQADPNAAHVALLDTKNKLSAVLRFDFRNPNAIRETIRAAMRERQADNAILDVPILFSSEGVTRAKKYQKLFADAGIEVLDVIFDDDSEIGWVSGRESGALSRVPRFFGDAASESSTLAEYEVREDSEVYGDDGGSYPYADTGAPDRAAPLAIRMVPEHSKKPVKLREWEKVRLANMDKVKPLAMPELYRLIKALGVDVKLKRMPKAYGRFHHGGNQGMISLDPRIFQDPVFAAAVFSHEIGHLADWLPNHTLKRGNIIGHLMSLNKFLRGRFAPSTPTNKEVRAELWKLSKWWRPLDEEQVSKYHLKYRKSAKELYADAVSVLLNSPKELKARAPTFYAEFWRHLDRKPTFKKELLDLWEFMNRPAADISSARSHDVRQMFVDGAELMARKSAERDWELSTFQGWVHRLKKYALWQYTPALEAAKARGDIPADKALEYLFDEFPLGDNKAFTLLKHAYERGIQPLEAAGIDKIMLSEYLFYNRIANESIVDEEGTDSGRSAVANPKMITPIEARQQLWWMRRNLGMEKMTVMEHHAKYFQNLVFDVMKYARQSGLISDKKLAELDRNRFNYVTFQTLEKLKDNPHVSATLKKSLGTEKDIGDTVDMTLMKSLAIIRFAQYNNAKLKLVDRLKVLQEIEPAKTYFDGKKLTPYPPPHGKENMTVYRDGKPERYVVAEEMVRMFDHITPAKLNPMLQIINIGMNVYYGMWIKYNPGFQAYRNLIRDFRRTARNLPPEAGGPGIAHARAAWSYMTSFKDTWRRMKGINAKKGEKDVVAEMMAVNALGTPYDTFTRNAARDDITGQLLAKYHLLPPSEQSKWRQNKIVKPLMTLGDGLSFMGAIFETVPKIGSYKLLVNKIGMDRKEAAYMVRNRLGTPPFHKKGRGAKEMGVIHPFANIFIQGWNEDIRAMTDAKTRGAWWLRWAATGGMFTLLKWAASQGMLGDDLEEWMKGVSEYKKSNYDLIPLGFMPGKRHGKKSFGMQIPKDETSRLLDAAFWKVLNTMSGENTGIGEVFAVGAGAFPGLHPNLQLTGAWAEYISNQNPIDTFYNQPILSRDEANARGWPGARAMLLWSAKKSGAANFFRYNPNADTTTETVLTSTMLLNSMFFVTDYGYEEARNDLQEIQDRDRSKVRLSMQSDAYEALREYNSIRAKKVDTRTEHEIQRYNELGFWYRQAFKPAWEGIDSYIEQGDMEAAKNIAKTIPAP
jgi:proteasome lid subunit RPN8/RPN11